MYLTGVRLREPTHQHILNLEVVLDAVLGTLASRARLFHATKRRHLIRDNALVNTHDPVIKGLANAPNPTDIAGIEITGQPKCGVISELDNFFLRFERRNGCHRAKNLIAKNSHIWRNAR